MAGQQLETVTDGIYALNSSFAIWGCTGSVRMSAISTGAGVVLFSPVALDASSIAQIGRLGPVTAIVAPNLYHHMYLRDAVARFPDARVLVPVGLESKIGPIERAEVMEPSTDLRLPPEIQHHVLWGHAVHETLLFHSKSRTLITADLIYNYQREQHPAEKLFFRMMGIYGRPGVPPYHRLAVKDRGAIRDLIGVVQAWRVRRIVPCHGRIIERADASELFASIWQRFA